jgi:hypothetical protein
MFSFFKPKSIKINGIKVVCSPFGFRIYTRDFEVFRAISKYIKDEGIKP